MALERLNRRQFSALAVSTLAFSREAGAAAADPFNYQGPDREKFLTGGARREAKLTLYSSLIPNLGLKAIVDGFRAKYPFVDLQSWRGTEGNVAQKTMAELRAGPPVGDLLEGSELAPIFIKSGLLQRFSSPQILKTPAAYRDKTGLTAATRFSYYGTAYNTKLVPPGTQPQSFSDLLLPKWKNRLAWRVGSDSGAHMFVANLMLTMGEGLCDAYLAKLAAQNVVGFTGSAQALIDRVIAGEYAVTLTTAQHLPIIAATKGAPIAAQVLQPMPSTVASIMIPKGTQHPHAAMLFVDYMLSVEGQTVLAKAQYFPVNEEVAPMKVLQPVSPRASGLKETFIDDETLYATHGKVAALLKKHFA